MICKKEYSSLLRMGHASCTKATNDISCNVTIGRRWTGDFVVLDCFEGKFTLDKLLLILLDATAV